MELILCRYCDFVNSFPCAHPTNTCTQVHQIHAQCPQQCYFFNTEHKPISSTKAWSPGEAIAGWQKLQDWGLEEPSGWLRMRSWRDCGASPLPYTLTSWPWGEHRTPARTALPCCLAPASRPTCQGPAWSWARTSKTVSQKQLCSLYKLIISCI